MRSCVAVVDPISTGANMAAEVASRGYGVIAVWCREVTPELRTHVPLSVKGLRYLAEVSEMPSVKETAAAVRHAAGKLQLLACIVGCDTGVTLADALSEELGLLTNGTAVESRRNKSVQQRLVKAAGLRAAREGVGRTWEDVRSFVESEPLPVIVKPVESAGSDGVKLCRSIEQAQEHFDLLMRAQRKVGSQDAAVLVQEFLRGKEYVVDHVSRDGVHKTVALWVYDKRPCNGSQFVYFGMLPVPSDSEVAQQLIPYVRGVLDALQIRHGPTHGEVILTADGPCLVEMNCRAHGGDGSFVPLARALTGGYSQVDAAVDAFLDKEAFARLPERPPSPFLALGQCLDLVSMQEGTIAATPGYEAIRRLPSFVSLETCLKVGSHVERTVDMFSQVGSATLIHADPAVLARDIEAIRQMEVSGTMFELEECSVPLSASKAGA